VNLTESELLSRFQKTQSRVAHLYVYTMLISLECDNLAAKERQRILTRGGVGTDKDAVDAHFKD
jgi:hypothetical protein